MRLLMVEDSALIRKVTRLAFPSKEHELVDAEDGQAALQLVDAATEPFDAILLDLNMPRIDGCQFIQALRQRARHRDTPVVLATSEPETSQLLIDARTLSRPQWSRSRGNLRNSPNSSAPSCMSGGEGRHRSMGENSVVRQALLQPPFAHLYPGIMPNEWQPASIMLEQVNATRGPLGSQPPPSGPAEALDPRHFALRNTSSAGAKQVARELRSMGERRRPV